MAESSSRPRGRRRRDAALSRDVVVDAAVLLLDRHGERGFTFPLLTAHLHTGNGAVYWHVANKDELVALAADRVLASALPASSPRPAGGRDVALARLRAFALDVFDALDAHPWAASHVVAGFAQPATLRTLEVIGSALTDAGLPESRRFLVTTALFNEIVGVSAQITGMAVTVGESTRRDDFLAQNASTWEQLDADEYPFLAASTAQLRDHDDRDQFVTGLDLILGGLAAELSGT